MRVVGLDLSLTATGIAVIDDRIILTRTVGSKPASVNATLAERSQRIGAMSEIILNTCRGSDLVVVEAPAYSASYGSAHDRAGLWWRIVGFLHVMEIPVAEVSPAQLKTYATGSGNAGKDAVMIAVTRRYDQAQITNNNESDALVLAAMGARHLDKPLDAVPATHIRGMTKVRWP